MIEDDFSENLFIKQTETPRPQPDQIDKQHRESDREQGDDRPEPFQDALKHLPTSARDPRMLIRCSNTCSWIQESAAALPTPQHFDLWPRFVKSVISAMEWRAHQSISTNPNRVDR